jgi:hypothetical protein
MATEKKDVLGESGDEINPIRCKWCGAEFQTKRGLNYHLSRCEYKPDSENGKESGADSSGGVDLYGSDESDNSGDGDDTYQCPDCGYSAKRAFIQCPNCAADLEW